VLAFPSPKQVFGLSTKVFNKEIKNDKQFCSNDDEQHQSKESRNPAQEGKQNYDHLAPHRIVLNLPNGEKKTTLPLQYAKADICQQYKSSLQSVKYIFGKFGNFFVVT